MLIARTDTSWYWCMCAARGVGHTGAWQTQACRICRKTVERTHTFGGGGIMSQARLFSFAA